MLFFEFGDEVIDKLTGEIYTITGVSCVPNRDDEYKLKRANGTTVCKIQNKVRLNKRGVSDGRKENTGIYGEGMGSGC